MNAPLTPERLAEIRESRYRDRSLAAADVDIDDLLAELDRVNSLLEFEQEDGVSLRAKVDRLREFERRVTDELEVFEESARKDPETPRAALFMISLLRNAVAGDPR